MAKIVGLTGGIGSGKSAVARIFEELGADVIDADRLAREAVLPGSPALSEILARFGDVATEGGELDRKKLGEIVFGDPEALKTLNAIVHPEVRRLATEKIGSLIQAGSRLIVYDVPLLYETGLETMFETVIVVSAPDHVRKERIELRDKLSDADIDARIAAQWALSEKVQRANFVIDNGGSLTNTRVQVEQLYQKLIEDDPKGSGTFHRGGRHE